MSTIAASLADVVRPTFTFEQGGAKSWWLEFAADSAFLLPVRKFRVRRSPTLLPKGLWKQILKRLDKAGAAGTGYWRLVQRDVLKREVASPARSFRYTTR